jgi:hypothetical protein
LPGRRLGAGAVDIVLELLPPAAGSSWRLWLVSRVPVCCSSRGMFRYGKASPHGTRRVPRWVRWDALVASVDWLRRLGQVFEGCGLGIVLPFVWARGEPSRFWVGMVPHRRSSCCCESGGVRPGCGGTLRSRSCVGVTLSERPCDGFCLKFVGSKSVQRCVSVRPRFRALS